MQTSISNARPNYFTLIRVVCIFTGFLGIIGSSILLWKAAMRQMSPMYEIKGGGIDISDVIWFIQSLALIGAGIWILFGDNDLLLLTGFRIDYFFKCLLFIGYFPLPCQCSYILILHAE
jgi:hypothetical protein